MNKIKMTIFSIVLLVGCVSTEFKESISKQAARSDNMVAQIDSDITTRAHEQSYIKAMRILIHVWDNDLNDAELPYDVKEILSRLKAKKGD